MRQQPAHPLALREARLQQPDLLHRQREPARQGDHFQLVHGDPVGSATLRFGGMHALRLQCHQRTAVRRPKQQREQERRGHRLTGSHARIGAAHAFQQHVAQRATAVGLHRRRAFRQQHGKQAVALQAEETLLRVPGQEQLQAFLEQSRRRSLAQQAAVLVQLAVAAAVVAVGAEGGDFDDLAAEHHVCQAEPAADQPAVAEQRLDLFRGGVGGDVEILGMAADQQVADRAADQVGVEPAIAKAIEHAQRVRTDVLARNRVSIARDDTQRQWRAGSTGIFLFGHRKRLGRRQAPDGGTGWRARCLRQARPIYYQASWTARLSMWTGRPAGVRKDHPAPFV